MKHYLFLLLVCLLSLYSCKAKVLVVDKVSHVSYTISNELHSLIEISVPYDGTIHHISIPSGNSYSYTHTPLTNRVETDKIPILFAESIEIFVEEDERAYTVLNPGKHLNKQKSNSYILVINETFINKLE